MKQKIACLFLFAFFISRVGYSQISKGFWMFGGSGEFSSGKVVNNDLLYIPTTLQLRPKAGYFFIDKFAAGLNLNFFFQRSSTGGPASKSSSLGVGPFTRYYFLEKSKQVNILSELHGTFLTDLNSNSKGVEFGFSAGIAVFLNSSVAIEFLPGYQGLRDKFSTSNYFTTKIGIQVHLEKNR